MHIHTHIRSTYIRGRINASQTFNSTFRLVTLSIFSNVFSFFFHLCGNRPPPQEEEEESEEDHEEQEFEGEGEAIQALVRTH